MSELSPQTIVVNLVTKGNELVRTAKQACIYHASIAYIAQHLHAFLVTLRNNAFQIKTDAHIQALRRAQDLFDHIGTLLPHLTEAKWIQPALNWPVKYVHECISGIRKTLIECIEQLDMNPATIVKFDEQQDHVNHVDDLSKLRKSIQNLMTKIHTSDAVGVQHQIEVKLREIKRHLPQESDPARKNAALGGRRPSCDSLPVYQIQSRVEELLSQFKALNIEGEDLQLHGQVGTGGFGTVHKATRLSTAEVVAVKELRSDRLTVGSWASLYAEMETMASVRHQFVLELVGAHITEPYRIITRFCSGKSLFDRLHRSNTQLPALSPTRLTTIAYQVAVGMEHLHKMNIVHRDLKTLNILLDEEDDACVADFGLSGMMKDNQELAGGVGTPHYTAPEVLSHTRYGPKVDTFSYGVVLWEMLNRKVPYGEMSHMAIYEHVVTRGWRLPISNDAPDGIRRMITRCWSKNPNDRPDFTEIVEQFEAGNVYFPESEKIDFKKIKAIRRCPPLDLKYALPVLRNPEHENFTSVSHFIVSKIDEKLRQALRKENIMAFLTKATVNIDTVLLLASVLLEPSEYEAFLQEGGLTMFEQCVSGQVGIMISADVKFGLKVPTELLPKLKDYLPDFIRFLTNNECLANHDIIQFLTRFTRDDLVAFTAEIGEALLQVGENVDDQNTFDAIVSLLPMCQEFLTMEQLRIFYHLISKDFIVPSAFIQTLIKANDEEKKPELIYAILRATAKSQVTDDFVELLQTCSDDIMDKVWRLPRIFETMNELIMKDDIIPPLFLLFWIAPIHDAALELAESQLIASLIHMKGHQTQRLQILTILCSFEDFCTKLTDIDGIIHLLVFSLSEKSLTNNAARLVGSLSSHAIGCQILNDNGVLELFTQLFLSSWCQDTATAQTILRNVARSGCEIPQASLIVSCLMQDMIVDQSNKCEIMDTLVALVEAVPNSVQEHDLQMIVMQQLSQEKPLLVLLALKLFAVCDSNILRNIYTQLLTSVNNVLNRTQLHYPEIIVSAVSVITNLAKNYDITEFLRRTEMTRFIQEVIQLLPESDTRIQELQHMCEQLS